MWYCWNQCHFACPTYAAIGASIVKLMRVEKIEIKELMVMLNGHSGNGRPSCKRRRISTIATRHKTLLTIAESFHNHESLCGIMRSALPCQTFMAASKLGKLQLAPKTTHDKMQMTRESLREYVRRTTRPKVYFSPALQELFIVQVPIILSWMLQHRLMVL